MAARRCGKCMLEKVYPEEGLDGKQCVKRCLCWGCLRGPAPDREMEPADTAEQRFIHSFTAVCPAREQREVVVWHTPRTFRSSCWNGVLGVLGHFVVSAPLLPKTSKRLVEFMDRCILCGHEHSEDVELVRRRRQVCIGVYIASSVLLLTICYYLQNFAAATALGAPTPFSGWTYLSKYSTQFGRSQCGPLGGECKPFDAWVPIRCDGWISKNGEEDDVFGSGPYRADSAVCKAAMHSGFVGDGGGCVDVRIGGPACEFTGSFRNGIWTRPFDSWFPVTLDVRPSRGANFCGWDGWWALMLVNVVLLWGLTLLRPNRRIWFWSVIISLYWYAALGSSSSHLDAETLLIRGGSCGLLVLCCHWLLWEIGGAKHFLPDFEAGAPFDGLMEVLLILPLLHQHLLKFVTGDHDLDKDSFGEAAGPVFFGVLALIILPIVIWMLRKWWYSGLLRGLACTSLAAVLAVVMLTFFFATSDFSFHLHHYFLGLLGCLFFRGNIRLAVMMRALCLGSFINGVAFWGFGKNLPIWAHDPSGNSTGLTPWRKSSTPNYTAFAAPEGKPGVTQFGSWKNNTMLTISWTYLSKRQAGVTQEEMCELLEREMSGYESDRAWVLEMNHIEIYRGRGHTVSINLSDLTAPCGPGRYHFVIGTLDTGPWEMSHRRLKMVRDTRAFFDGYAAMCRRWLPWRTGPLGLNASSGDANSSVLNASS